MPRPSLLKGFDVMLSADTIYSPSAAPRLWTLLSSQLRPGGVALIAAKSYYFGVGGSVASFKALAEADGRFELRLLRTLEDGSSNRREVFAVKRRLAMNGEALLARRHFTEAPRGEPDAREAPSSAPSAELLGARGRGDSDCDSEDGARRASRSSDDTTLGAQNSKRRRSA